MSLDPGKIIKAFTYSTPTSAQCPRSGLEMLLQDVAAGGRCGIQNQSDFCIAIAVFTSKTKPDPFQSCDYECAQRPKSNSVIYGCANSF